MNRSLFRSSLILLSTLLLVPRLFAQNDHYPQFMEMGNRAYNGEKFDLAREYYQSALDDNSDCWQAYVGLGNCDYAQKKYKEALKNYEIAIKMNPDNPTLMNFLQAFRYKMGIRPTPTPTLIPLPLNPVPGPALPPPGSSPAPAASPIPK